LRGSAAVTGHIRTSQTPIGGPCVTR